MKKKAGYSRLVGGRFNKQGNLQVVSGDRKGNVFLHPLARMVNVYIEVLTGFSYHTEVESLTSPDSLITTLLSQVLGQLLAGV